MANYPELCNSLESISAYDPIGDVCRKGVVIVVKAEDYGTSEGAEKAWMSRRNGGGKSDIDPAGKSEKLAAHEALAKANWEHMEDRRRLGMGQPGGKAAEGKSYPLHRALKSRAKVDELSRISRGFGEGKSPYQAFVGNRSRVNMAGNPRHNPSATGMMAAARSYKSELSKGA